MSKISNLIKISSELEKKYLLKTASNLTLAQAKELMIILQMVRGVVRSSYQVMGENPSSFPGESIIQKLQPLLSRLDTTSSKDNSVELAGGVSLEEARQILSKIISPQYQGWFNERNLISRARTLYSSLGTSTPVSSTPIPATTPVKK